MRDGHYFIRISLLLHISHGQPHRAERAPVYYLACESISVSILFLDSSTWYVNAHPFVKIIGLKGTAAVYIAHSISRASVCCVEAAYFFCCPAVAAEPAPSISSSILPIVSAEDDELIFSRLLSTMSSSRGPWRASSNSIATSSSTASNLVLRAEWPAARDMLLERRRGLREL